jgi:hypothetical protein
MLAGSPKEIRFARHLTTQLLGYFTLLNTIDEARMKALRDDKIIAEAEDFKRYYDHSSSLMYDRAQMIENTHALLEQSAKNANYKRGEQFNPWFNTLCGYTSNLIKCLDDQYISQPELLRARDVEIGQFYWTNFSIATAGKEEGRAMDAIASALYAKSVYSPEEIATASRLLENSFDAHLMEVKSTWDDSAKYDMDPALASSAYLAFKNTDKLTMMDRISFYMEIIRNGTLMGADTESAMFERAASLSYYSPELAENLLGKLKAGGYIPNNHEVMKAASVVLSTHGIQAGNANTLIHSISSDIQADYMRYGSFRGVNGKLVDQHYEKEGIAHLRVSTLHQNLLSTIHEANKNIQMRHSNTLGRSL